MSPNVHLHIHDRVISTTSGWQIKGHILSLRDRWGISKTPSPLSCSKHSQVSDSPLLSELPGSHWGKATISCRQKASDTNQQYLRSQGMYGLPAGEREWSSRLQTSIDILQDGTWRHHSSSGICTWFIYQNPFPLLLNPQIIKTSVRLQFWKMLGWPIWLLIDAL